MSLIVRWLWQNARTPRLTFGIAQDFGSKLAQRTRLRLCTGIALLPAWPVRKLALDAAELDQLSGGRLILGAGLGTRALQTQGGWPADSIGEMADETLEALRHLWSGASTSAGKHVTVGSALPILLTGRTTSGLGSRIGAAQDSLSAGFLERLRSPALVRSLWMRAGLAVAIVALMVFKPDAVTSSIVLVAALGLGFVISVVGARRAAVVVPRASAHA
jgi:hypothetical protein